MLFAVTINMKMPLGIIGDRSLSLRLASNNNHSDDFKKQLRSDIANIVRSYEKAKTM